MKARVIRLAVLLLILLVLAVSSVQAMGSTNYLVDWFHPMTGTGMISDSSHYAVELTVGQTSILQAGSANVKADLGYWRPIQFLAFYFPSIKK